MHPQEHSSFYNDKNLGFDLQLVEMGFKKFKPYFKGDTCLELGPATGYMTKLLVPYFKNIICVEGSLDLYNQIPYFSNVTKINSLFEDFYPNEKFDTIIINHVLEHIEKPIELLKRIKHWIAPNGVIILGVPNAKSFHRLAAVKMGLLKTEYELNERDLALGHYRVYDFETLIEHCVQAGLKIFSKGGIFLKFLSNNQIETKLNNDIINAYFELGAEYENNCAEIFVILNSY